MHDLKELELAIIDYENNKHDYLQESEEELKSVRDQNKLKKSLSMNKKHKLTDSNKKENENPRKKMKI